MTETEVKLDEKTKAELKAHFDNMIAKLDKQIKSLENSKKKTEMILTS